MQKSSLSGPCFDCQVEFECTTLPRSLSCLRQSYPALILDQMDQYFYSPFLVCSTTQSAFLLRLMKVDLLSRHGRFQTFTALLSKRRLFCFVQLCLKSLLDVPDWLLDFWKLSFCFLVHMLVISWQSDHDPQT